MPRAFLGCCTIVAAFQIHLAAAPAVIEEAPLSPAVIELASRFDVDPLRDPTRFMSEMARALYALSESRPPDLAAARPVARPSAPGRPTITVPVPLPASTWGPAVFHHLVPADQLVTAILSDRRAALLCRGLSALDDETLEYLAAHPAILSMLYERGAGVFAAFGQALRIHGGRVVTPGGSAFEPLWQAAAEASLDRPDLFVRIAFTELDGRFAYLLDTLDAAAPDAARFALGAWMPETARVSRFRSLLAATVAGYREWHPAEHPFARPLGDLAMLLLRIKLTDTSALAPPASRAFWHGAFDTDGGELLSGDSVDAAWLVWAIGAEDMYARIERLDQVAFGQRVFGSTTASASVLADIMRPMRRYKMLLLTLERLGTTAPDVYAHALQRAAALADQPDGRRFWSMAQFQGSLAFITRLRRSGTINQLQAETLARSLIALPLGGDGYHGAVALWWQSQMLPTLPPGPSEEARAISAMAGASPAVPPRLVWEGQLYRIDLAFAERQRITTIRRKQGGQSLDLAIALATVAEQLQREGLTVEGTRAAEETLHTMIREAADQLRHPAVNLPPPGVLLSRDALAWITEASQRLSRVTRPNDVRRAAEIGESLEPLVDIVLGNALVSLAYAADLGDPAGAAMLAGNVALRHDFGFERKDTEGRARAPWAQPRQEFQPGVPWHVAGSLLSLDLGLAPLSLQRASMDRVADAPKLSSIEREAFAANVAFLDPLRLRDADRDVIAAAIARGRDRVATLRSSPETLGKLADELGLDGYRRRALSYALAHDGGSIDDQFSVSDLLTLGGGTSQVDLNAWGTSALQSFGCICASYLPSRAWRILDGRPQLPMMAATMGDLTLTMAVMLHELNVPTLLLKSTMAIGMQELIDGLGDRGDWWGFSKSARAVRMPRVEDYVSTAAAVDGPLVPIDDEPSTRNH